ncbi:hypothetical protein SK3146_04557 [Paenibacillus konkukensis]|uniref:Uncharacterized protein n=1 Tax=Paenibacillus konkukensis TaxID=2020716 RepID=A0ABY4RT62_9BACL|nr:hypothetical protein SK3146_04557 [Paenibacillus konkukensis]
MLDICMIAMLAAMYGLFYGFMTWCGRVVAETGGDSK